MTASPKTVASTQTENRRGRLNCNYLTYLVDGIRYFDTLKNFQWIKHILQISKHILDAPNETLDMPISLFTLKNESIEPTLEICMLSVHFRTNWSSSNSSNQKARSVGLV